MLLLFGFSAVASSQVVTLDTRNVTLNEALKQLKNQTGVRLFYDVEKTGQVACGEFRFDGVELKEVLGRLLENTPFGYQEVEGVYVIRELPPMAKAVKVTGQVVDKSGEPLPGVSVILKGTTTGVATDVDGRFELLVPDMKDAVLVFSFVGMKTKEVAAVAGQAMRIVLEEDAEEMDEVIVTGYQTISRERATGAFSKLDAKKLETQRLSTVGSLLEGRVAGYSDGKIRGVTSMNGVTTPLYVIDGFPVEKTTTSGYGWEESVPDLNMEDIESITILKDAAATSIYGARAANGVVVITTKKAKKDRLDVSLSATLTVQPYRYYTGHLADAATMIDLEKEWAAMNPNLRGADVAAYAQNLLDNATYTTQGIRAILNRYAGHSDEAQMNRTLEELASRGYRYYKDIEKYGKKNPFAQQYNLSVGRGTEKNTFNASLSYRHNQLEDKYSKNESLGLNLQNTTQLTSWLSLDLGTYLNYTNGTTQNYSLTSPGFTFMPYDALVNADGSRHTNTEADRYSKAQLNTLHSNGLYNLDITPLDELGMNTSRNKDFSNRTFARLNLKFTEWLKYTASFQYEIMEYKTTQLQDKNSYAVKNKVNAFATAGAEGQATFNLPYGHIFSTLRNSSRAYNFRQQLDFNKTIAEKHDITALAGMEVRENKNEFNTQWLYNYDPDLLTYDLVDAKRLNTIRGLWGWASFSNYDVALVQELVNRFVSFYANAAYTFDKKYMLTGSIRWDRANLFGTSSKYQKKPIWSVGAAWNISNESFFAVNGVDMLKLRASYGIGGNIAKNAAPYMTANYFSNNNVGGIYGSIGSRPNPELRWEKTATLNIGIDFALLNNRLNGTLEYYNRKGSDLLANTNGVPTEGWGYSTYSINNGKMTNRGFELTLSGNVIETKDWQWNVSGLLGYNKNKVTYVNVKAPGLVLVFDQPQAYPRVGNPYNAIYGYQWAGLNEKGMPQVYDTEGNIFSASEPYNVEDAVYLGTTVPVYSGSINTNLRYKNWELAAQFLFEGGHKMRNTNVAALNIDSYYANMGIAPVSKNIENRWKQPGDETRTDVPRFVSSESPDYNSYAYKLYARSSVNVLNAANWRMKNLSVAYRLPAELCKKLALQEARIMFGMENLFTTAKSHDAKWMLGGYDKPNYLCTVSLNF